MSYGQIKLKYSEEEKNWISRHLVDNSDEDVHFEYEEDNMNSGVDSENTIDRTTVGGVDNTSNTNTGNTSTTNNTTNNTTTSNTNSNDDIDVDDI